MTIEGDWVDRAVRQLWLQRPGIGVNALRMQVQERCREEFSSASKDADMNESTSLALSIATVPDPSLVTKARIKHSKAFIPYRYLPKDSIHASERHRTLVETKLQERMAYRATRDYQCSDEIQHALEAMGVEIDDRLKTWTMVQEPPAKLPVVERPNHDDAGRSTDYLTQSTDRTSRTTCQYCHKVFPSRNHVFKHLRDATSGCGTAIFASGQKIEVPPSVLEANRRKKELMVLKGKTRGKGRAARHASAECSLWMGALPFPWTNPKKRFSLLRAMLHQYLPRSVPTPWIKRVMRKGYRKESGGVLYGWAIVVFRDADEAQLVLGQLNGREVDPDHVLLRNRTNQHDLYSDLTPFMLRVRAAEKGDTADAAWKAMDDHKLREAGLDPPLIDQLRPLELDELRKRMDRLESKLGESFVQREDEDGKLSSTTDKEDSNPMDTILSRLVTLYTMHEGLRIHVKRQGRLIPNEFREKLLSILESLRWPARNHRHGLASERYLVLQSNVSTDRFYGDLRNACRALMDWADPNYFYSGIAVTKNFVASPHIDHRDQSFQYAVSLGGFGPGGELCVEGLDSLGQEVVNVVTTHNRIARVDGRHVHYVRTWEHGDRYSLIFYDTSDRHPTPTLDSGVDESFLES